MLRLKGAEHWYAAAERVVDVALRREDALFTPGRAIWTLENVKDLYKRFVGNPDESSDSFEVKLRRQMKGAPPDTVQLAGEVLYAVHRGGGPTGQGTLDQHGARDLFLKGCYGVSRAYERYSATDGG